MNALPTLGPWSATLGWLALEAAVVVLAALAVQPLVRVAATRRSLWRAVLVALGLLLAAEFTGATGQFSAQLRAVWQSVFAKPAPPQLPPPPSVAFPLPDSPIPMPAFLSEPEPLPDFTALPPDPLPPAHSLTLSPAPAPAPPVWPAFLWLAGLAALLARAAWAHVGFAWLRLRHFLPAAEALCQRVQTLAARLGLRRRVRVLASERLRAPAAFGWLRPGVGVPGDFTVRFAPAQQDVMLAHELAHLAARDPLWQLLADLVTAALWWHPLAWVARRQHRLAGELAADDASLALPDGPVVLAECLLTLGHEAADCPRAALGMAGFRSQLGRRVERLLALPRRDWQAPSRARLALQTAVALLALAALALLPGCAANRTAGEAPSGIVAKWWQAKDRKPEPPRTTAKERTVETQDFGTTIFRLFNERRQLSEGASSSVRLAELENQIAATITAEVARLRAEFTAASAKLPTDLELLRKHLEKVNQSLKQLVRAVNTNTLKSDQRHLDVMQRHREEVENKIKVEELDRAIPRFATQGRVLFNGTPLPERDIPLPPPVLAARTNTPLKTRFHRVSPDGGLADVLVYVKEGLAGQTFDPPTNVFVVWADRYEFEPHIGAIQAGQTVRWESRLATGLSIHPTPTNRENREFNFTLMANKSLDARFTGPELFLRVKTDVYPWMFHYISVLPHPYFAVTDAEGRFRFPSPLPPGKYTLAAVHRRAGEAEQMLDLTQPLPAGASVPSVEFHFNAPAGGVTTLPPLISFPQRPAPPVDFAPSKPPTREELLERKARVEAEIKAVEKVYRPTHPKMIGLRKQLETVEEALRQQALVPRGLAVVSFRLNQVEYVERKVQNPVYTTSERLQFYAAVDYGALRETPTVGNPRTTNGTVIVPRAPGTAIEDWAELERERVNLERTIKEASQTYRPSHPKMQTLNKQLEAINRLLEEEEQKAAAKFKFLKRTLQQQQRELLDQQGATLPPAPVAADVRRLTAPQTPAASQSLVTSAPTNAPLSAATEPRTALDNLALADVVLKKIANRRLQLAAEWKLAKETLPESHPKLTELKKQFESMTSDQIAVVELEQVSQFLRRIVTLQEQFESPLLKPSNRLQLYTGFGYQLKASPANSEEATEKELEHARVWFQEQRRLLQHRQAMLLAQLSKQPTNITPIKLTNLLDISVGRQLFVDDFLVESNTLKRTWHRPTFTSELPQLVVNAQAPLLGEFPFSESVRYDFTNQIFNLRFNFRTNTVNYTSPSGTNWREAVIQPETALLRVRPTNATTHYESLSVTLQKLAMPQLAKNPDIFLGFSREGALFRTTSFKPFIPLPKPADGSQWSDLNPMTNGFLVVGRNLYFYFGGRVQRVGETHASAAVGLATLRRDGFASLDAGPEGGVLTTKPVTFTGKFMFVNFKTNAPDGEMRIEILDADGNAMERFSRAKCIPLAADQTLMGVSWQNGAQDLSALIGTPVRFRFHLKNASLYSFWVGPGQLGRSMGRVAGGGPHFTNDVDTIGNRSYRPFPVVSTNAPAAPKPGSSLQPAPAPVAADVRRLTSPQTPPINQSLVTSAATPVQLAAASPKDIRLPVPNPYHRTNSEVPFLTHSSKGAQRINRKLEEIVLPEVHFDAVPLVGVVQRLIEDAKKFDPEKQGLNFLINDVAPAAPLLDAAGNPVPVARPVALSEGLVRVSQPLKNLTLRQALDVICKNAELPTQFSVEEYAIAFIPRGPVAYYSRMFRVNPDALIQGLQGVVGNPVLGVTPGGNNVAGATGQNQPATTTTTTGPVRATVPATVPATQRTAAEANALVRQFFQSAGVTALGATNSSTRVTFNPENGLLLVRGTTNDLRVIEQAIQKVQPLPLIPTTSVPNRSPKPTPDSRTNSAPAPTSKGAQIINHKLDEILIPGIRFDSVPLPQVVTWLEANVKMLDSDPDPTKKGLPFLLNNLGPDYISQTSPPFDNQTVLVKLPVALTNLTLRQVLDVICKATIWAKPVEGRGQGLKYTVEEYAIVFSPKLPERASLFPRMFKVDAETFIRGLRSVVVEPEVAARAAQFGKALGPTVPALTAELNVMVRDYFRAAGVANLGPTNSPDTTQVFFNDRNGLLLVRASLQDLDIIQQAIELLNAKPPTVKFEVQVFDAGRREATRSELALRALSRERPLATTKVLAAAEVRDAIKAFGPAVRRASAPSAMIASGQSARVEIPDPRELASPKVAAPGGLTLSLAPVAWAGGIELSAIVTEVTPMPTPAAGSEFPNSKARDIYDHVLVPGQPAPGRPLSPLTRTRQGLQQVSIPAGHSVLLTLELNQQAAKSNGVATAIVNSLVVIVTPTLVDSDTIPLTSDSTAPAKK